MQLGGQHVRELRHFFADSSPQERNTEMVDQDEQRPIFLQALHVLRGGDDEYTTKKSNNVHHGWKQCDLE
jgi:hypothetical protein